MTQTHASREGRVLRFLSRPASYPHPVDRIERRETHVSHVFLAGPFAYKLKKPVTFPFLDASTLALRLKWCRLELSLNRRLAPTMYLDVVPIVETSTGLQLGGRGRVVEWVVKMRRLPEDRMLDRLLTARAVRRAQIDDLGRQLIRFFGRAARSRAINAYGRPASVRALVLGNLQECQPFLGALLSEADRGVLEASYRQFLALHEPLLARRVREGRIIDGHGDLRCENICLTDPVTVFDCVEFQPAFRCGDVVNDLSFLLMDLEFRGRADLATTLIVQYQRAVHDSTMPVVLPFYQCHRSLVRGKVRGFAWLQHPKTAQGRRIRVFSRRHFKLAVQYARRFAPPRLIVIGGPIGTGKSSLARGLAEAMGAMWLRTDEIRLREFARYRRGGQGFAEGLYAPAVSARVYQGLIRQAAQAVAHGQSVICDGTFSKQEGREALRHVARRAGASFYYLECSAPKALALRRLVARAAAKTDLSEARPEHYAMLKAGYEPVRGWPASAWSRLSTIGSPAQTVDAALALLRKAWA